MALQLPSSIKIERFQGGYRANFSYPLLGDTETNKAQNVFYGTDGNLTQRPGTLKRYNQKLFTSTDASTGRPITGHYYFEKLGANVAHEIVAAGDSLYSYNSSTANAIRTGLADDSDTFWSIIQTQDPRSAADDWVLACNGQNPIQAWNGSATAIVLSSITSATQVPIAKYLLNLNQRVYAINITDATDADAQAKVVRTGFGSDGLPDPHRFTENFYVGGSSRGGAIQNVGVLQGQIIFYKQNAIWKFNPSAGGVADLFAVQERTGMLAPHSLVDIGNFHIFLSDEGVKIFNGVNLQSISTDIDDVLFSNSNLEQLSLAKATYDKQRQQYILYIPQSAESRNSLGLVYDVRPGLQIWQPPILGHQVSFVSTFRTSSKQEKVVYGDYLGYLYEYDDSTKNDGLASGYNSTASTATISSLTDSNADFSITGDGLAGLTVRIIEGTGQGQSRIIQSNDSATLSLESDWIVVPDNTSQYTVGAIDSYWQSKDYDFGQSDIRKIFRYIYVRSREEGLINLLMTYIVDFKPLGYATQRAIQLLGSGMVWDLSKWNQATWGGGGDLKTRISLRSTNTQSTNGTHLALRFGNEKANETWKLKGYDIIMKAIGRD